MASEAGNQTVAAKEENAAEENTTQQAKAQSTKEAKAETTTDVDAKKKGGGRERRFTIKPEDTWASYVPHDHRDNRGHETNLLESVAHLVKGCLGAGMLGMPFGFKITGLWTAFFTNIASGFLVAYGIQQLVGSAQLLYPRCQVASLTYSDLAEASLATAPCVGLRNKDFTFRVIVDIVIALNLFSSCCVYQIIIAATIKQILEAWNFVLPIRAYIAILWPFMVALCMIRSLKFLAPFSIAADLFIVVCVITTIYYGVVNRLPIAELPSWQGFLPFIGFIGISVFSVEGIGVALAIENQMKKPEQFIWANIIAYTIVVVLVNLTGFFGYWGYGSECLGSILLNFPSTTFLIIIKLMISFVLFVTFAINFWVPFNITWFYMKNKFDSKRHVFWERIIRAVWVTIISLIALCVPTIGNFIGLIGSFCLSMMSFMFVPIIELVVIWEQPGLGPCKIQLVKNVLLALFSLLLFGVGTYQNVVAMIKDLS